jgi:hypothetical protein
LNKGFAMTNVIKFPVIAGVEISTDDQELFRLSEKVRKDHNGENQTYFKTLITAKGQQHIQKKFFNRAA